MKIRKAKKQDLQKIWEIEKQSRSHHKKISQNKYKILSKSTTDKKEKLEFIKDLEKEVNSKKVIFLVAEISQEVVGWIWARLGIWKWSNKPPKMLWVEDIGVLKKYQKQGIAKKLLKETEKKLQRKKE